MKEGKTDVNFNLNAQNEKTSLDKLADSFKKSMFGVLYLCLKTQSFSMWAEVVFTIIQMFQLMAYTFRPLFLSIWKAENSSTTVSNFLGYFQIVLFFDGSPTLYVIAIIVSFVVMILLLITIIYLAFSYSNKSYAMWPVKALRTTLCFICSVLVLPILELFISIFNCIDINATTPLYGGSPPQTTASGDTKNAVVNSMLCYQGAYLGYVAICVIGAIFLVFISLLTKMAYYETKLSTQNQTAKLTSSPEVFLLLSKFILILIYGIARSVTSQWLLIIITFALAFFIFNTFNKTRPFFNHTIMKTHLVCWGLFFWNTIVILIGKCLESTNFDGSLALFFIGLPVVIALVVTNYDDRTGILMADIKKLPSGDQAIKQIHYLLEIIDKREYDREAKVMLKSYIYAYEETCFNRECALKKYLYSVEHNLETISSLIQHVELLYTGAISKFPNYTPLRLQFAFFLLERMNKKSQCVDQFISIEKHQPRFEEQFIMFRYLRMFEDENSESNESEDSLEAVSNIVYKQHINQFKSCISKVTSVYVEFWSLLLNQDSSSDLTKLNEYGSRINSLVKEIHEHFQKMQKLKHNDQEVVRLYADFLQDIINDNEKANNFKSKLNEIEGTNKKFDEANYINLDMNALQSSDEYQYVIISGMTEKFGTILNISLGLCNAFGYSRNEVIGKNVEAILPEIYHEEHRKMLISKINDYKKITMSIQNARNYKASFATVKSVGKVRSRFIIPTNFKVVFIPNNEQGESIFLGKQNTDAVQLTGEIPTESCYVLIDKFFVVQNFSSNSMSCIGMATDVINNNDYNILEYLKEFSEEWTKYADEMDDKTDEQKILVKRHLLTTKYKNATNLTFMKSTEEERRRIYAKEVMKHQQTIGFDGNPVNKGHMSLEVSPVTILGNLVGFIMKFNLYAPKVAETPGLKTDKTHFAKEKTANLQETSMFANLNVTQEIDKQLGLEKDSLKVNEDLIKETPNPDSKIEIDGSEMRIDKGFLPASSWSFHMDPKKMSYLVNPKNLNEIHDTVKEEAMKKLRIVNEPSVVESDSSYSSETSFEQNIASDEPQTLGGPVVNNVVVVEKETVKRKTQQQDNDYYRVDLETVKFLQYELKKDFIVEVMDWARESQVEAKCKRPEESMKRENEDEKIETADGNKESPEGLEEEAIEQGKEGILVKQIEYALSKEETQPTITRMKWYSFFVFLIYCGFASLFLALFLISLSVVTENINNVFRSYDLIENTIYSVFHTRELVLLNNPKYINTYQTGSDYVTNNTQSLLNLFSSSYNLIIGVDTSTQVVSADDSLLLNNKTITSSILQDDLSIRRFQLVLNSAFTETNTALYHIAHLDISQIFATNKDVFFYLYNALNDISIELYARAIIYMSELDTNVKTFQMTFLYIFIGAVIFGVISYFVCSFAYLAVEKRKESYLEVFFEISPSVIKESLNKCEEFSKKVQQEGTSDTTSNLDDAELNGDENKNANANAKKSSSSRKKGSANSKEARIIKIKLIVGIFIFSIFFFVVYIIYQNYLANVEVYTKLFQITCLEQTKYLSLLNTLREYFFDTTAVVDDNPVPKTLYDNLNQIYNFKLTQDSNLSSYQSYFPSDYSTLYEQVINQNICSYSGDLFTTFLKNVDCTTFVSNSSSYGLNILLTNYVELLRYSKYKFDLLLQNAANYPKLSYNNTLYLSSVYTPSNDPNYDINDPFQIFNDPSHLNLVILSRYLLRPAYGALKDQLKLSINNSISSFQTIYIIVFAIFLSAVLGIYLFIWRPFENGLNLTIYKTKNMLQIIPKEVLASLSNIHKLLDIGQNVNKKNRSMKA